MWRKCLSFEHEKYKETSQSAFQLNGKDARDRWLSYIMMRKVRRYTFLRPKKWIQGVGDLMLSSGMLSFLGSSSGVSSNDKHVSGK